MVNAPALHRRQRDTQHKLQTGVIVSHTVVRHPPAGFPSHPRSIGLIRLQDGTSVVASIESQQSICIGQSVQARLRLSQVNGQGLRCYDVVYEVIAGQPVVPEREPLRYILALTGPVGVGRSTVSVILTRMLGKTAPVPLVTTESQLRLTGQNNVVILGHDAFATFEQSGALIGSPKSAGQERIGYFRRDIEAIWQQGKMPVVVTEIGLLQALALVYGRRSILSFGLLPPGRSKRVMLSHLIRRLRRCERYSEEMIRQNLEHAEAAVLFLRQQKAWFEQVIVNDDPERVLGILHTYVPHRYRGDDSA